MVAQVIDLVFNLLTSLLSILPASFVQSYLSNIGEINYLSYVNYFIPFYNFVKIGRLWLDAVRKRYYKAEDWSKFSYESNISKLTDDEFVDELGREFIGERHRRIDLIRWNRFSEGAWWDKTPDATNQDVFPIPYRALNANPLLKQTTAGF